MNLSTLSLDERERLAYAEGYTETAALLAEMADLEARAEGLETDLEDVKDRAAELITERDTLKDELDDAESLAARMIDERDEAQEQAKTYRAALMALEAEVSPNIREFIREVLA